MVKFAVAMNEATAANSMKMPRFVRCCSKEAHWREMNAVLRMVMLTKTSRFPSLVGEYKM